jgi:hypothetical protein
MSRRLLSRKTWLMMTIVLSLACWCCPAAAYELKVEVLIDGYSQLIIQGNTLQWHNINHDAPGYLEGDPGSPFPTYLTTADMGKVAWTPTWPDGGYGGHENLQDSSIYTGLNLPLAAVSQTVQVVSWSVDQIREGQHSVTISQQPSSSNNYKVIVDFDDLEPGGAAWYTVTLDYIPVFPTTYTFYPIADATVYVGVDHNYGTDVNLTVQSDTYSYLKFDLSTISTTQEITGATLNAFCNLGFPSFGFAVDLRAVSGTSWITGKAGNYPALGSVIATNDDGTQNVAYHQWALGAAYLPRGLVSYALTLKYGSGASYNSRQNSSNKPYLVVTTKPKSKGPAATYLLLLD